MSEASAAIPSLLARWQHDPTIAPNIAHHVTLPPRPARTVPLPEDLHPALRAALQRAGISQLYSHQAHAWEIARQGSHLALVTPTASGKSLAYHLPVLHQLLNDPQARALYLFPTKALAHDQENKLRALWPPSEGAALASYDGDTPSHRRPAIRRQARLLLTNPDMLHAGILPRHPDWMPFFAGLRFVVIDEMHAYRGVFGSHVANVLRRLRRVTAHYGAAPQFLLASATIANPRELAEQLVEDWVTVITENGAPRGERHVLLYNPPLVNPDLGLRASPHTEAVRLADDLTGHGVQTVIFERSRRGVELTLTALRERAGDRERVRGYRSGYLPQERRAIEAGLRSGAVRAVVATNALELGVDIGGLDAALLVGYPGSLAATRQQMGRAGRGTRPALAAFIASAAPIDQYLVRHPAYLLDQPPEQALIHPDNLLILLDHLRCAAYELPFRDGEGFGRLPANALQALLAYLIEAGSLDEREGRTFYIEGGAPASSVSLRSTSAQRVVLVAETPDGRRVIGEVDRPSAFWMVHPGAIYLHQGETFRVTRLDLEQDEAHLLPVQTDYFTEPRRQTDIELEQERARQGIPGAIIAHGDLRVTTQVVGYRKIHWETRAVLAEEPLDLPPEMLLTQGFWVTLDESAVKALRAAGLWRNDPNTYGADWPRLRDAIRARDGYRCQVCGAPETDRAHDVHHITPFRLFSSPAEANRPENLVTLCRACHRRAEAAVRVRSGLSGLAYVLHHLAPLLLMCDVADLGVHADPNSPLGGGQPSVVIHETVPGGVGFAPRLFEQHAALLAMARERVRHCDCSDGCPSCTGPGGPEGIGARAETLAILNHLLEQAHA